MGGVLSRSIGKMVQWCCADCCSKAVIGSKTPNSMLRQKYNDSIAKLSPKWMFTKCWDFTNQYMRKWLDNLDGALLEDSDCAGLISFRTSPTSRCTTQLSGSVSNAAGMESTTNDLDHLSQNNCKAFGE